jgi:hypothetical protein
MKTILAFSDMAGPIFWTLSLKTASGDVIGKSKKPTEIGCPHLIIKKSFVSSTAPSNVLSGLTIKNLKCGYGFGSWIGFLNAKNPNIKADRIKNDQNPALTSLNPKRFR